MLPSIVWSVKCLIFLSVLICYLNLGAKVRRFGHTIAKQITERCIQITDGVIFPYFFTLNFALCWLGVNGKIDTSKIGMIFYESFNNQYFSLGEKVGNASLVQSWSFRHLYLNPFGAEDAAFIIAVTCCPWAAQHLVAIFIQDLGKTVHLLF